MTAQRILLGALLAGAAAVPAAGQGPAFPAPPASAGTGAVPGGAPLFAGPPAAPPSLTDTLTAPPGFPGSTGPALASPPGCCGPVGGDGPITYDVFFRTGPTWFAGGGSELTGAAEFGWAVQGGGRTLLFNPARDAAWALEVGLRYAYNGADQSRVFDVFAQREEGTDPTTGASTGRPAGPDELQPFRLRGLTRTEFTWGIGRDYFLNGPGVVVGAGGAAWNSRVGYDVGGRWGQLRADLVPVADLNNYFRRNVTSLAVTGGVHWDAEMAYGASTLFTGVRVEYGHTWSNVVPPQDGNLQDISILLTLGVRF